MSPRESESNASLANDGEEQNDSEHHDEQGGTPTKVIVVGSGPAGLLTALYMLRRNKLNEDRNHIRYHVTLVDYEDDYTFIDQQVYRLKKNRENFVEEGSQSLKIGLTAYALDSIRTFPNLYEDYVARIPVEGKQTTVDKGFDGLLGLTLSQEERAKSGFMVDRKAICLALASYLDDTYIKPDLRSGTTSSPSSLGKSGSEFTVCYNTQAIGVNEDYKYVLVRNMELAQTDEERDGYRTLEYDLLIGCDGVHPFVRNMFEDIHDDFAYTEADKVGVARTMTLEFPRNTEGSFMTFIKNMPNITTAIFPEEGSDQLLLTCGYESDRPPDPELESGDPELISAYFETHFKAFAMDWEEVGYAWVQQPTFKTGMMSCNYYHSMSMMALLIGDEASMTTPNIGNGINRALIDARMFDVYLNKHEDNLEKALPAYSNARNRQVSPLKDWFASL